MLKNQICKIYVYKSDFCILKIYLYNINIRMEKFCKTYNVSRETYSKLELYCQSLKEWQQKFNLVSNSSIDNVWVRHFEDSAQLFEFIPKRAKTLLDMGSGAGFPGMVISIMARAETPYLKVTLAESIGNKTLYLKYVNDLTEANAEILNLRVEKIDGRKFDVITSRAMTSLSDLLRYAYPLLAKQGVCIFPKGKSADEEILNAKKIWNFDCEKITSKTSEDGKILIISNIRKKGNK